MSNIPIASIYRVATDIKTKGLEETNIKTTGIEAIFILSEIVRVSKNSLHSSKQKSPHKS